MQLPQTKSENVVVQHLKGEILIYDLTTNKAFCLNETAAKVFNCCDGQTSFAELKSKYNFTDDMIYLALDDLKANGLIEDYASTHFAGMSRREVIKKVGIGTMIALPVISALVAPPAISAASSACTCTAAAGSQARLPGCPCTDNEDCCGVCQAGSFTCSAVTPGSAGTAAACCPPLPPA